MLDIFNLKTEPFGLDISDLSLKITKLKRKKKYFDLTFFSENEIKPGVIREGEIKDEKKLTEAIVQAIKMSGGRRLGKYVVASLPEEKAFLQVIQLPRMSEDDLDSAVVFEAENYIPLPIDQVYLDYEVITPLHNHLDHFDILLAALPRKIVDSYVTCLRSAGLVPKALEIESLAIARSLVQQEKSVQPLLLIDLGATRTSFIVFAGHSIRFTSSIPVSGKHFTQIIAKSLGVKEGEAERLKMKYGLEEKVRLKIGGENEEGSSKSTVEKERGKIFEALVPALVDLVQQIKKHLEFYQTHSSHEHLGSNSTEISKILFCGGGANLKGLAELLALELRLPVELGNPWTNILEEGQGGAKGLSLEKSLGYATALGLALRGIRDS
ncbi:MAG: type IV pilus assembly protein PilM [Candidatus Nealsonbacteria bacterium]|nr:type IV pilus assembly protein PilM [Candidatus Nealsonbacteria bacterium]